MNILAKTISSQYVFHKWRCLFRKVKNSVSDFSLCILIKAVLVGQKYLSKEFWRQKARLWLCASYLIDCCHKWPWKMIQLYLPSNCKVKAHKEHSSIWCFRARLLQAFFIKILQSLSSFWLGASALQVFVLPIRNLEMDFEDILLSRSYLHWFSAHASMIGNWNRRYASHFCVLYIVLCRAFMLIQYVLISILFQLLPYCSLLKWFNSASVVHSFSFLGHRWLHWKVGFVVSFIPWENDIGNAGHWWNNFTISLSVSKVVIFLTYSWNV